MILDEFHARILIELQADSTLTAEGLGGRVALSASAVTKRLAKLRQSGVIARTTAVLDLDRIGPSVTALVLLNFDPNGPLTKDDFVAVVRPRIEVTHVLVLTGDLDVAVLITTRTLEECGSAVRALQESFPQVRNLRDYIVMSQPKRSLAVPFTLVGVTVPDTPKSAMSRPQRRA